MSRIQRQLGSQKDLESDRWDVSQFGRLINVPKVVEGALIPTKREHQIVERVSLEPTHAAIGRSMHDHASGGAAACAAPAPRHQFAHAVCQVLRACR